MTIEGKKKIFVTNGDSVTIPVRVEPQSMLSVENWAGNSLVSFDKHLVRSDEYDARVAPITGQNKITFTLTDRFNNTATDVVIITRSAAKPSEKVARPEYGNILARKQNTAYIGLMKNRADKKTLGLITESGIEKRDFEYTDDMLDFLKKEAPARDVQPVEIDKLALRIALMDNVLTQSAVDILADNSSAGLRDILSGLDIREADLKTWTGLLVYIGEKSSGTIRSRAVTDLAYVILGETDPAIATIKQKILAYSEVSQKGDILKKAVNSADSSGLILRGRWLGSFYSSAVSMKLMPEDLADMLAIMSAKPGSGINDYLNRLTESSDEPLTTSLRSLDTGNEKISSPADLVFFLLKPGNSVKYPEDEVFKALANLITSENLPLQAIKAQVPAGRTGGLWIVLAIAAVLIASIIFFLIRSRRKAE